MALEIAAHLLGTDGALVAPMIETYRLHAVEVGQVTVRAGQHEEPAELLVVGGRPCAAARPGRRRGPDAR